MEIEISFTENIHRSVIVKADSLQDAKAKWLDDDDNEWFEDAINDSSEDDSGVDRESAVFRDLN